MKHLKKFNENFADGSLLVPVFPYLEELIETIWDGDVSYAEAIEGFTLEEAQAMDALVQENPTVFAEGVPYPGDDDIFDEMLAHNDAAKLIQKMVNNIEGE